MALNNGPLDLHIWNLVGIYVDNECVYIFHMRYCVRVTDCNYGGGKKVISEKLSIKSVHTDGNYV
jgi:hypothetical protein